MRVQNKIQISLCVILLAINSPVFSNVLPVAKPVSPTGKAGNDQLIKRLEEIKTMDTKNLSRSDKRALRKEVKHIEKQLTSGGVYISAGALLIIVILLIILL
jgi:hypothetical protein